jgi:regulator of sigma E protease
MINTIITILEFILFFGLMIFVHELGHFLAGRFFKFGIEEFGFGYPPRMVKLFTHKGTIFSINWIPFGGFVRFKGEDKPDETDGFSTQKPYKRLIVLSSGAAMNILTGILIFSLVFTQTGIPDMQRVEILETAAGSPAETAGILPGDLITAVNQVPLEGIEDLSARVSQNLGNELVLTIQRGEEMLNLNITPRTVIPEGQGAMGIVMTTPVRDATWFQAVPYAAQSVVDYAKMLIQMPFMLIRGQIDPADARVVGPKGIYDMFSSAREADEDVSASASGSTPAVNTLWLLAILSVAIGITNLLPIPALDGGRILFLLPELLFKRRIKPEYESMVHLVGFALLIVLMIYVTFQDFANPIVPSF